MNSVARTRNFAHCQSNESRCCMTCALLARGKIHQNKQTSSPCLVNSFRYECSFSFIRKFFGYDMFTVYLQSTIHVSWELQLYIYLLKLRNKQGTCNPILQGCEALGWGSHIVATCNIVKHVRDHYPCQLATMFMFGKLV